MRTDDIVRQRFTKVFKGYDVQEVDLFLDDVIRAFDQLEAERNKLLARLELLMKELERCDRVIKEYNLNERTDPVHIGAVQRAMLKRAPVRVNCISASEQAPQPAQCEAPEQGV